MDKKKIKTKGMVTPEDVVIGENLFKIRKINGMTQVEVADILGVSFQQIQKYEKGVNRISAWNLLRLSKVFDVDIRIFYVGLIDSKYESPVLNFSPRILRIAKLLSTIEDEDIIIHLKKVILQILKNQK